MVEKRGKCSSCGSTNLIPNLNIVDHGYMDSKHQLAVELFANPDALVFKGTTRGVLKASICAHCGHVDLSVDNPEELMHIYQQNDKQN